MNKISLLSLLFFAFTLFANVPPANDYGNGSVGTLSGQSLVKSGQYRVPVSSPHAAFVMTDVSWEKKDGKYRLQFRFPNELLGYDPKADLRSTLVTPAGYVEFQGKKVSASCFETRKRVLCLMTYSKDFTVDLQSVEELLKKNYPKEEEMLARLNVSKFFSNDPAGIVELELR